MPSSDSGLSEAIALDKLSVTYRDEFNIPTAESFGGTVPEVQGPITYLAGNSLGLMPKATRNAINDELDAWSARAVDSHFRHPIDDAHNWMDVDLPLVPSLAKIVGAKESEVACMGTLTMNLNALLAAFYRPTATRFKILFEKKAFPSDFYAFLNAVKLRGFSPEEALIQIEPRKGEFTIRTEDILESIDKNGDEIALVCFPGIQYYTGQFFDLKTITDFGHSKGCIVGWDLAHVAGNIPVKLHDLDVDFACWCSYKYLNSGPGGIGCIFVHERWSKAETQIPRVAGWWGNNREKRFEMLEEFDPIPSALGFRQSNPSVLDVVALHTSLKMFERVGGIDVLFEKSRKLTKFLEDQLHKSPFYLEAGELDNKVGFTIITPTDPNSRGAQLSVLFSSHALMEKVNSYLQAHGIVCDERKPSVIRIAPTALYNTFEDVFRTVDAINTGIST
ncbi:unnamed protein product [Kuraishia capsulata CBS 1993]|uniref:Kynureninase n=1 Tax=Kuraishia capsulata CBS 1993 TaxID=1382522 RepID=W6MPD6_9ASCO|nr:uncharacterized protein KUCA_T00004522001 [Kuraishia capsulata CBS 1993]CDK28539.1 unnamed protein product [Kuraishia capsulata CBS 1993]